MQSQSHKETPSKPKMSDVPEPRCKSDMDSNIANYPLHLAGFTNSRTLQSASRKINECYAGLMPIIDEVYVQLHTAVASYMPLSAFSYYIIIQLWGRIAAIRRHHGLMTHDERYLLNFLSGIEFLIPEPIAVYFRAIGDEIDSNGVETLVNFAVQPTADWHGPSSGWAGRVTGVTHNIYESIPMPGVSAARLCADVVAALNPGLAGPWQVPDTIRPMAGDKFIGGYPTVNLLGYGLAVAIKQEQMQTLRDCGITSDNAMVIGPFALNHNLLTGIYRTLVNAEKSFKMDRAGVHSSRFAVQPVVGLVTKDNTDAKNAPPISYYVDNTIAEQGSVNQNVRFFTNVRIFMGQMKRNTLKAGIDKWCCFNFNNYGEVPADWIENLDEYCGNEIFIMELSSSTWTDAKRFLECYVRYYLMNRSQT